MALMQGEAAKELALERIRILICNALESAHTSEIFADKQAQLAKKIAMRSRVRMDYDARQLYCKKCKKFIIPGKSSRVRVGGTNTKSIRITCIMCGHTYRKILQGSKVHE
jgi:ribonuclease P protein subunit RPR2